MTSALGVIGAAYLVSHHLAPVQPAHAEAPEIARPAKSKTGTGGSPLSIINELARNRRIAPQARSRAVPATPSMTKAKSEPSRKANQPEKASAPPLPRPKPHVPASPGRTEGGSRIADSTGADSTRTIPRPMAKPDLITVGSENATTAEHGPAEEMAVAPVAQTGPATVEALPPAAGAGEAAATPSAPADVAARGKPASPAASPAAAPLAVGPTDGAMVVAQTASNLARKSDPIRPLAVPVDSAGRVSAALLAPVPSPDVQALSDEAKPSSTGAGLPPLPVPKPRATARPEGPLKVASLTRVPLPRMKPQPLPGSSSLVPKPDMPDESRGSGGRSGGWPADQVASAQRACQETLSKLDIRYRAIGPIGAPGGCGAPYSIEVTHIAGVVLKPAATMNCKMAAAMHQWIVSSVQPAAAKLLGEPVTGIGNASSYVCRRRYGASTGKMSEHAYAGAFDVGVFFVASGRNVGVMTPSALIKAGLTTRGPAAFLDQVRGDACKHFSTVLGPGYNAAHATHFHFDLGRNGRYLICK